MTDSSALSRRTLGGLAAGLAATAAFPVAAQQTAPANNRPGLTGGDWFTQIKAQHKAIDEAIGRIRAAKDRRARNTAFTDFKGLLTAHSFAEEAVIYPALANLASRENAKHAFDEQADASILLGQLDMMARQRPPSIRPSPSSPTRSTAMFRRRRPSGFRRWPRPAATSPTG
jgi:hypothetical protein